MPKPITSTKGAVPTGYADEIIISENTFRSQHRKVQAASTPSKKRKREETGDTSVVYGANAYKGPWAKFKEDTPSDGSEDEDGSEEEEDGEEEQEEDEEPIKMATDYEANDAGESTEFHGSELYDYQGRSYMHVPLDLDIDLRGDVSSIKSYWPKNLLHTWKEQKCMIDPSICILPSNCFQELLLPKCDSSLTLDICC